MSGFARAASSVPVGTIINVLGNTVPAGYARFGQAYPKVGKYAKLYAALAGLVAETSTAFILPEHPGFLRAAKLTAYPFSSEAWQPDGFGGVYTDTSAGQNPVLTDSGLRFPDPPGGYAGRHLRGTRSITSGKWAFGCRLKNAGNIACNGAFGFIKATQSPYGPTWTTKEAMVTFSDNGTGGGSFSSVGLRRNNVSSALATSCARNGDGYLIVLMDLDAGTWGIIAPGINDPVRGSTSLGTLAADTYAPRISWAFADGTDGSQSGVDIIFGDLSEYGVPGGYANAMTLAEFGVQAGATGGAATHSHTVGGTALTIAQMPAHTHTLTGAVLNNASTSGGGPNDTPTNQSGTLTTSSQGSGQTHTHTLTTESSLPPYLAGLYAIKY